MVGKIDTIMADSVPYHLRGRKVDNMLSCMLDISKFVNAVRACFLGPSVSVPGSSHCLHSNTRYVGDGKLSPRLHDLWKYKYTGIGHKCASDFLSSHAVWE